MDTRIAHTPQEVARMTALRFSIRFLELHRGFTSGAFFGPSRYIAQGNMVRLEQFFAVQYPKKKKRATASRKKQPPLLFP